MDFTKALQELPEDEAHAELRMYLSFQREYVLPLCRPGDVLATVQSALTAYPNGERLVLPVLTRTCSAAVQRCCFPQAPPCCQARLSRESSGSVNRQRGPCHRNLVCCSEARPISLPRAESRPRPRRQSPYE